MRLTNGDLKQILRSVLTGHFIVADIHATKNATDNTTNRAIDQLINSGYAQPFFGNTSAYHNMSIAPDVAHTSLASMIFTPTTKCTGT